MQAALTVSLNKFSSRLVDTISVCLCTSIAKKLFVIGKGSRRVQQKYVLLRTLTNLDFMIRNKHKMSL